MLKKFIFLASLTLFPRCPTPSKPGATRYPVCTCLLTFAARGRRGILETVVAAIPWPPSGSPSAPHHLETLPNFDLPEDVPQVQPLHDLVQHETGTLYGSSRRLWCRVQLYGRNLLVAETAWLWRWDRGAVSRDDTPASTRRDVDVGDDVVDAARWSSTGPERDEWITVAPGWTEESCVKIYQLLPVWSTIEKSNNISNTDLSRAVARILSDRGKSFCPFLLTRKKKKTN